MRLGVDHRAVAPDHTLLLELADPVVDGGGGEPDARADVGVRGARVVLQRGDDVEVACVQHAPIIGRRPRPGEVGARWGMGIAPAGPIVPSATPEVTTARRSSRSFGREFRACPPKAVRPLDGAARAAARRSTPWRGRTAARAGSPGSMDGTAHGTRLLSAPRRPPSSAPLGPEVIANRASAAARRTGRSAGAVAPRRTPRGDADGRGAGRRAPRPRARRTDVAHCYASIEPGVVARALRATWAAPTLGPADRSPARGWASDGAPRPPGRPGSVGRARQRGPARVDDASPRGRRPPSPVGGRRGRVRAAIAGERGAGLRRLPPRPGERRPAPERAKTAAA